MLSFASESEDLCNIGTPAFKSTGPATPLVTPGGRLVILGPALMSISLVEALLTGACTCPRIGLPMELADESDSPCLGELIIFCEAMSNGICPCVGLVFDDSLVALLLAIMALTGSPRLGEYRDEFLAGWRSDTSDM